MRTRSKALLAERRESSLSFLHGVAAGNLSRVLKFDQHKSAHSAIFKSTAHVSTRISIEIHFARSRRCFSTVALSDSETEISDGTFTKVLWE